jgi:hypothetical protein
LLLVHSTIVCGGLEDVCEEKYVKN